MVDDIDLSDSTLRLILWKALKSYSTSELTELLSDEDYIVRTAVAKQLHLRPSRDVFVKAIELCKSDVVYKREIAAFLLGQLGTPEFPYKNDSTFELTNLISDDSYEVRAAAICALGHLFGSDLLEDERSISKILSAANDESDDVRISCAFSLSLLPKSEIVMTTLDQLSQDKNEEVRSWADTSREIIEDRQTL
jgi:HEAT repeat protein